MTTITGISVPPNKAVTGANAFAHESGIHQHGVLAERTTYEIMTPESIGIPQNQMVLGKHSGRHAFEERLETLGYHLSKEELDKAFIKFKDLADKKKVIRDPDLETLVQGYEERFVLGEYQLESFIINSGNRMNATAAIKLRVGDEIEEKMRPWAPGRWTRASRRSTASSARSSSWTTIRSTR